jgi:hypothetical protein
VVVLFSKLGAMAPIKALNAVISAKANTEPDQTYIVCSKRTRRKKREEQNGHSHARTHKHMQNKITRQRIEERVFICTRETQTTTTTTTIQIGKNKRTVKRL